jgi:hypothetical protein
MGQAKVRRKALLQKCLKMSEEWDFPPSPWEAAVCADLREEDVVVVARAPIDQLAWARMPANECHANVRWYAKNDPSGNSRAVVGWWVQWPNFVLHSVVEIEGQLICITPSPYGETEIPFIPDPKIEWIENGDIYSAIRDGRPIGIGVRVFPKFTMAQNAIVRERLLGGCDPLKAGDFSDEEMEELKRQYIPFIAASA